MVRGGQGVITIEFRDPLSDKEQRKLAIKAKTNSDAKDKLILHNFKLVHWVAKKYVRPGYTEFDDLFQLGVIGLMEAIEKYDPYRGARFSTVAVWHMKNSIRDNIFTLSDHVSLDEPIADDELFLKDTIADDSQSPADEALSNTFIAEFIAEFKDKLPWLQLKAVLLTIQGYTSKDIGAMFGVEPYKVQREKEKALRAIRQSIFIKHLWREVDERTKYYRDIDYTTIPSRGTRSPVERAVLQRERIANRLLKQCLGEQAAHSLNNAK